MDRCGGETALSPFSYTEVLVPWADEKAPGEAVVGLCRDPDRPLYRYTWHWFAFNAGTTAEHSIRHIGAPSGQRGKYNKIGQRSGWFGFCRFEERRNEVSGSFAMIDMLLFWHFSILVVIVWSWCIICPGLFRLLFDETALLWSWASDDNLPGLIFSYFWSSFEIRIWIQQSVQLM